MSAASSCVFCAIAAGGVAHRVGSTADTIAFLDRAPVFRGHVLVIPRDHATTMVDAPLAQFDAVMREARRVAQALPIALGCTGTFVAVNNVVSQSVPHLHVHVIPRTKGDGLRGFFWPRVRYADEADAAEVAARIADALSRIS